MLLKRWHGSWPAMILCVFSGAGCSHRAVVDPVPSYADLVVTYNAELETLDRLEAKREKLIEEYAALTSNTSGDLLSRLDGLLQSASDLKEGANLDASSDPNALLDNLTERSGQAEEIAGQLLDGLLGGKATVTEPEEPTPEAAAAVAERKAAFERELANLDLEITKQKGRVERARQARDAVEAKSKSSE